MYFRYRVLNKERTKILFVSDRLHDSQSIRNLQPPGEKEVIQIFTTDIRDVGANLTFAYEY